MHRDDHVEVTITYLSACYARRSENHASSNRNVSGSYEWVNGDQFTDVTKGTEMSEAIVKGAALLAYAPIIKGQR
jgi:hypothetical protein